MDGSKIERANGLYAKLQGAIWAKEKNEEYGHYGQCESIRKLMCQWRKEIEDLGLTQEEQAMVGYGFVDYELAEEWYDRLR